MKKIILIVFLMNVTLININFAEYEVKSDFLKNPEKNIEYIISEADFWKQAEDSANGGFFCYLDEEGNITNDSLKSICGLSRLGYAFSKAFMVTGNLEYLKKAHIALRFLYEHGWDQTNGGWYFSTDEVGELAAWNQWWDPNTWKWSFLQHYSLVGIGAVCAATHGNIDWSLFEEFSNEVNPYTDQQMLQKGFQVLDQYLWDDREGYKGYYSQTDLDWQNPTGKGFTPTVDGVTTNALALYLLSQEEQYKQRLIDLADNMAYNLVASMDDSLVTFGIAEEYDSEWNLNESNTSGSVGHVLKTSWCLARAYLIEQNEDYRSAARKLFYDMWDNGGYDHVNGGPFMGYNWSDGSVGTGKDYWMVEQAIMCGLINYYIAQSNSFKDDCLEMADESIDFYMNYFWDQINGGSYFNTDNTGLEVTNKAKGDIWKSGYHGVELGYYSYLYASLYYKDTTASLYYYFPAKDSSWNVSLYPIAIEDDELIIKEARLDGNSFENFNPNTRTLNIAANEGGIFKVTYENTRPVAGINDYIPEQPGQLTLSQNFPNPFHEQTKIGYSLNKKRPVLFSVFDITGKMVYKKNLREKPQGQHSLIFAAENIPSGIYFYQIKAGSITKSRKMIYLK